VWSVLAFFYKADVGFADGALRQILHWCKERGVFF